MIQSVTSGHCGRLIDQILGEPMWLSGSSLSMAMLLFYQIFCGGCFLPLFHSILSRAAAHISFRTPIFVPIVALSVLPSTSSALRVYVGKTMHGWGGCPRKPSHNDTIRRCWATSQTDIFPSLFALSNIHQSSSLAIMHSRTTSCTYTSPFSSSSNASLA